MIKHIMIAMILVVGMVGVGSASSSINYVFSGNGDFEYPNEGYVILYAKTHTAQDYMFGSTDYNTKGQYVNYSYSGSSHALNNYGAFPDCRAVTYVENTTSYLKELSYCQLGGVSECFDYDTASYHNVNNNRSVGIRVHVITPVPSPYISSASAGVTMIVNITEGHTVSGTTSCFSGDVDLMSNGIILFTHRDFTDTNITPANPNYSFNHIINGMEYTLKFTDGYQYNFTGTDQDTEHDYNACEQTTYRLEESCNNLIPDSEGYYCEYIDDVISCNWFEESDGILVISNSSATKIEVYTNTFIGQTGWIIDPVMNGTTYNVTNPNIAWSLKVIVQNESDESLIDGAMVKVDQGCYCTDGYTIRQKLTVNGLVSFSDMSLQDASLFAIATGYKTIDISSTNYSLFLSGLSNFSSKTWIVKLAPLGSDNESVWYEQKNKVDIHFRNTAGNRTSKIVDTDSQVYLYYENNNTNNEDMTLKFQSSSTHTHFIDKQSWNIPYDEIGHKIIVNADFTPWDYSYRAVIYNSSIYGWNMTIPLTVRNATKEENQHYENLSTSLWFMYANAGKIDYRSDMDMGVHACSNNTTLMYVDIELYKNNVLLCYKNMTPSNFINADFPYYYVWSPAYNYESGSNYSVRMYGFDRTLLETDYVNCYADNITRKNKLTIIVKNQYGTNLDNAFIYLEDYGSIPTGTNYYASFEGLDNEYYRFKATKPDYTGTGWDDITLSDSDGVVTYTLTSTDSEEGSATQPQKMDENELQNIYLIIMAFLLIFIIIGGLKYAL